MFLVVFAEPVTAAVRDGMDARLAPSHFPKGVGLATRRIYPHGVILSIILKARKPTQIVRYIVVLAAGFIAGSHTVDAARSWQEWHTWAARDPSGAEAYRTYFLVSLTVALLSLSIAGLVWWLLRPPSGDQGSHSI